MRAASLYIVCVACALWGAGLASLWWASAVVCPPLLPLSLILSVLTAAVVILTGVASAILQG